jgi:hypothetical protein
MIKRSIKLLAVSALFAMTLASATAQAVAQQQDGIVYQPASYEGLALPH